MKKYRLPSVVEDFKGFSEEELQEAQKFTEEVFQKALTSDDCLFKNFKGDTCLCLSCPCPMCSPRC